MSAEEFESWMETMEVMRDFPDLGKRIREVEEDVRTGAYKNYITLEELLAKEGYVLADKGKRNYGVSRAPASARRKRVKKSS